MYLKPQPLGVYPSLLFFFLKKKGPQGCPYFYTKNLLYQNGSATGCKRRIAHNLLLLSLTLQLNPFMITGHTFSAKFHLKTNATKPLKTKVNIYV